jgi:hypothetical protein
MNDDTRYFRVEGKVYVDREDVIDWLNEDLSEDDELDYDYQPTDEEWRDYALEMFENDEIAWSESDLIPIR